MHQRTSIRLAFVHLCICAFLFSVPASAQEPSLADVLRRAGAYVLEFQRKLSGIVAEEAYEQDVRAQPSGLSRLVPRGPSHRELKSDLLLVKPVGADRWIQFRDVFEVDGKPVRDRTDRLAKLFLQPSSSTKEQAERIVDESTRYNIGNLQRTVNVPVLALVILDPDNQSRFRFRRDERASFEDGEWVVQFQEVDPQTIIRTAFNRDLPTHGRFWIEPATGRVRRSEMIAEDVLIRGAIEVTYQPEPGVGLLVPVAMKERYEIRKDGSRVDGTATYSRFRQFGVNLDETFLIKK